MAMLAQAGISIDAGHRTSSWRTASSLFADAFDQLLGAVAQQARGHARQPARSARHQAACRRSRRRSPATLEAWRARRQGAPAVGWRCERSGPAPTKPNGSAGSTSSMNSASASTSCKAWPRTSARQGFTHVAAAGHGRVEPRTGGSRGDLRPASRASRAAGARFHRPGADPHHRKQDRSGAHLVYRVEQVRHHARAQHLKQYSSSGRSRPSVPNGRVTHFIAITDPGSKLQNRSPSTIAFGTICVRQAQHRRALFGAVGFRPGAGRRDGPRYERACSIGTQLMVRSCGPNVPPAENPGVVLGAILGEPQKRAATRSRIVASPGIADFGAWLEQLLAESTGKHRQGAHAGRCRATRRRQTSTARIACSSTCG